MNIRMKNFKNTLLLSVFSLAPSFYCHANMPSDNVVDFAQAQNINGGKYSDAFKADGKGVADNDTLAGGYKLLWHDEFNGTGAPDSDMWSFEEGFQRNDEDQWYSKNNAVMKDNALEIGRAHV